MDVKGYEQEVREALDRARDSLGRIEMTVRDEGETPALMEASKILAQFCMHARDYVTGSTLGRPMPHRFAARLNEMKTHLAVHEGIMVTYELRPSVEDLDRLANSALALPERMR